MPNHANCYCSRADFANQVKICVKSNTALKCTADADINITNVWVDGYCGDSRSGAGGNGGGTGNGNGNRTTTVSSQSGSLSTLTSSSATSGTAAPASTPTSPPLTHSAEISKGAKAGIAIGAVAIVAIMATLAFFLFRSRQQNKAKAKPSVYEVGDEKRVHEVDAVSKPSEMDSKDAALFSQPVPAPVPIYELPSPGGGGESELEDTQTAMTPIQPVSNSSPFRREELVSRDGMAANEMDARGGRIGGHK